MKYLAGDELRACEKHITQSSSDTEETNFTIVQEDQKQLLCFRADGKALSGQLESRSRDQNISHEVSRYSKPLKVDG